VQFRELEFLSGAKDPGFLRRFHGLTDDERTRLERRLDEPSLWDGFLDAVRAAGLPTDDDDAALQSLLAISRDRESHAELWELAEAMLDHDEAAQIWRSRHVLMVERQIGSKSGTGGSTGAPYLRSRIEMRYFPLLWELRSLL
jgi:tryptophan 2,3-dioxygenase